MSPYNESLLSEIRTQFEVYTAGGASLEEVQSFASNRLWLFERDGSGASDSVQTLIAEFEHILYAVPDADERDEAERVYNALMGRFLPEE